MRHGGPDDDVPRMGLDRSTDTPAQTPSLTADRRLADSAIFAIGLVFCGLWALPSAAIGGEGSADGIGATAGNSGAPALQRVSGLRTGAASDRIGDFVARVLAETSEVWADILPQQKGITYTPPQLVLYDRATRSACGPTFTAVGPFYCPLDRKIYLDTSFFASVKAQLGAEGDLAYTFFLAHEVGHHVQNELGILNKVQEERRSAFGMRDNPVSIRIELMADCYAGVWASRAENKYHLIAASDVAKLDATAQAIGDDRLEQAAQGIVVAATFTHGTSAQRGYWFELGEKSGQIDACNTFGP